MDEMEQDLITPSDAAVLWNYIYDLDNTSVDAPTSAHIMRRKCRNGDLKRRGIQLLELPGRWYISKSSLIAYILKQCRQAAKRCVENMDGDRAENIARIRAEFEKMIAELEGGR
jgi:hypothetical protein